MDLDTGGNIQYLRSKLLQDEGFTHAFFNKFSNLKRPEVLIKCFSDEHSLHSTRQVHGTKIVEASQASKSFKPECDGLISNKKNQSLWIYTSDCIPLLFADKVSRKVAAVHVGWRGLSEKIIFKVIKKLTKSNCNIDSLIVSIGPAISQSNYEVNLPVASKIYHSLELRKKRQENNFVRIKELLISHEIASKHEEKDKLYVDIRSAANKQLINSGLNQLQISINDDCTYSNTHQFNSWRRTNEKKLQWSFIMT